MIVNRKEWDGEALKELFARAVLCSKVAMTQVGRVFPTLYFHGHEGPGMFIAKDMPDERSKDNFAMTARLMCVAHGADAAVFVAEGWSSVARKGESLDLFTPPSQRPDRQEILMLMGETRYETSQKLFPILRSDSGRFLGFGEPNNISADRVEGRFANLLTENYPDPETQRKAMKALRTFAEEKRRGKGRERGFTMG